MSDVLILGLATIISGSVITPVVAWLIRRSEERVKKRVDEYHKEINSKLTRLVEAEKTISHAQGVAEEKEKSK